MFKVIKIKNEKQYKLLDKFANDNWGEHNHNADEDLDFFDIPKYIFTLSKKSTKVSQLAVFIREIIVDSQVVKMAGIGGVITHVDHRSKGYAHELMRQSIEFIFNEENVDVILLCTDLEKIGPIYKSVGFEPLEKPYFFTDINNKEKAENGGMYLINRNSDIMHLISNKKIKIDVGKSNF